MSIGHLLLAAGITIYILIAIRYEERDLVGMFGDQYVEYRDRAGMLTPKLGKRSWRGDGSRRAGNGSPGDRLIRDGAIVVIVLAREFRLGRVNPSTGGRERLRLALRRGLSLVPVCGDPLARQEEVRSLQLGMTGLIRAAAAAAPAAARTGRSAAAFSPG